MLSFIIGFIIGYALCSMLSVNKISNMQEELFFTNYMNNKEKGEINDGKVEN